MHDLLTLLQQSFHDAVIRSQVAMQNMAATQAHGDDVAESRNTRPPGYRQLILQDVNKVECAGGNSDAMAVTTASVGSTQNQRISKRHDTAFVGGMGRLHAACQQGEPHKVSLHREFSMFTKPEGRA